MIDRKRLLKRNNPHLTKWEPESPLTVGNGELAFTADVTGLQTFYQEQKEQFVPLCTMSQWGWHSTPAGENRDVWYRPEDVKKTSYESVKGTKYYASEPQPGNEEIYNWLRENPHRLNLARLGFWWKGQEIHPEQVKEIDQELNLAEGVLCSRFSIEETPVEVQTVCDGKEDVLGFSIKSQALADGRLTLVLAFPYGSKDITASDWDHDGWHTTKAESISGHSVSFVRTLDKDSYQVLLHMEETASIAQKKAHTWEISGKEESFCLTLGFSGEATPKEKTFAQVQEDSCARWKAFWKDCGMIDLEGSKDPRAAELERRIVLSQYLLALQSLGSAPPQETGLTCNSWYGKFHLEMYPWHCAWAALWNESQMLKGSLNWYLEHLDKARENAACNGYKGARWPKMVDRDGVDSPSVIATLLIWQQPHIIWMLSLVYGSTKDDALLEKFWDVIKETAEFMCDFASYNEETGCYDLPAPLIPAQEEHDPRTTKNPTYELEYWSFILKTASDWAEKLGKSSENWREIGEKMAPPPKKDGLYLACETCPDTFTDFNRDHPSMTAAFGLLPGKRIEPEVMRATLDKVLECWDFTTMWGWDFAMMAMTDVRLGDPGAAVDILLKDTPKNSYVASGNNYQRMRTDLPLYLPGNGSLLLAAAMMAAGYEGCQEELPGFPKDGNWNVTFENISPFPA